MALSEEEQRLLDQLEASLAADDPKLASRMGSRTSYKVHRKRATLGGFLFLVGVLLLILGLASSMSIGWLIGLLGFLAMFAATVLAITAWQKIDGEGAPEVKDFPPPSTKPSSSLEERWRRRQGF